MKKLLKADYVILPEQKILLEYAEGVITPGSLINLKEIEMKDPAFSPSFNFIGDISKTTFDISIQQMEDFVASCLTNHCSQIENKTAIILSTISQYTYFQHISRFHEKYPECLRICFDLAEAIEWINQPEDYTIIQTKFNEINENPRFQWEFDSDY
jgi:hypothetical protein